MFYKQLLKQMPFFFFNISDVTSRLEWQHLEEHSRQWLKTINLNYAFPGGEVVRNPPANAGDKMWYWSLGWENPLEKEMEPHSSILAWEIPRTRGAWQATVHGVTKSQAQLSAHTHYYMSFQNVFLLLPPFLSLFILCSLPLSLHSFFCPHSFCINPCHAQN